MKKKLLATLIAGAILSTGIIGLTACGNNNGDNNDGEEDFSVLVKGVQVDEDGWTKAFEASLAAESYTMKGYMARTTKIKGTDDDYGEIDFCLTDTRTGTSYYDGNTYGKTKVAVVATGVPDDEDLKNRYKNKEYAFEDYIVKDGETYYNAYYSTEEENAEWSVKTISIDSMGGSAINILSTDYETEKKGATSSTLDKLYESFTYEDGIYTATLWQYDVDVKVSVSVKDGYVVGYSTDILVEIEDEDGKESEGEKLVYNFSNFGKTTVTPSDAAKKAVEDYIAAHAPADSAVAGKTFVFESISFEYAANVSEAQKNQCEALIPQMEAAYSGSSIIFNTSWGFTITQSQGNPVSGTYTEDDNVILLAPSTGATPQPFTLSENKLTTSDDMGGGITAKMTYALQAD